MKVRLLAVAVATLVGCGGPAWTDHDTTAATHAVQLGQACQAQCTSDAGCSPSLAAGCFESLTCNVSSMLARHGAPDRTDGGAGCQP